MNKLIVFSSLSIMALISIFAVMNTNSNTDRKAEIEDSLTISMRDTLKATNVYKMYNINDQEMSAEFLRNFAQNINTDGDMDIYINESSTKGLLDVKVRETHTNINGKQTSEETRKTLILEITPK